MGIELKPVRTGSFPLMNIAEDYGLPLDVVYPYADGVRQNELRFVMGAEQNNDDVRHIRAMPRRRCCWTSRRSCISTMRCAPRFTISWLSRSGSRRRRATEF